MNETVAMVGGNRQRLIGWARSGVSTTGAQAAIQGLGFLAGVVIVRCLSPREYAFYTIATAGLGTMTVLTDSGIGSSVLALGGGVWQDRGRLGAVLATGIRLRRRFAHFALALALPIMIALLLRQGASWTEAVMIAVSVVPLFLATVTGHLLEGVPRLHQTLKPLQLVQIAANAARLILIVVLMPFWPLAVLASLLAALPQWWANLRLRHMADRRADWRTRDDPEVASRMVAQVRRTMPSAIYYALSGQLTVWLISVFGKTGNVAAIGALGRLAMILSVLGMVFGVLAIPRFARISAHEGALIRRRYMQAQLILIAVCCLPLAVLAVAPGPVLAILGSHYSGLQHEAVLMGVGSVASMVCGAAYTLGAARGIVAPAAITLPCSILLQILLIAILPLATVSGVIWVGILSALGQWLVHLGYFEWRYRKLA